MQQLQQTYPRDHGFKFRWKVAVGNGNGKAAQLEHAIQAIRMETCKPCFYPNLIQIFHPDSCLLLK